MNFLAISGSLRKTSYNTAALNALKRLAPENIEIIIFGLLDEIPLFNPDRELEIIPAVVELRKLLSTADGLIIASPEYAHGISGVLKNALDWLVSGPEFVNKPIMLINTSPRAYIAMDALREVVTTMSGIIIESACVSVPLLGSNMNCNEIIAHHEMADLLRCGLHEFTKEINSAQGD
ncbi:NADPH-dependent FMN reductase [Cellvibrio zantedeschiae]|nr:NADPH-dependent FMN reductase [Cellvibrio zantedeschiae]